MPYPYEVEELNRLIAQAIREDLGDGDVTTEATIPVSMQATAHFLAKADGVLAGLWVAERVFDHLDPDVQINWTMTDGDPVQAGTTFGTVAGPARALLMGERLALNLMQRMSGIATLTHRMTEAAGPHRARILDTRKTAPGLRHLDKWAVHLGGGVNHRIGLYDMILIKDNHITAVGGLRNAVMAAQAYRQRRNPNLEIEVETRTLGEVRELIRVRQETDGGIDRVLLDNMVTRHADGSIDTVMLQDAVSLINGRMATEASGNVTLETVPAIAATGVDFISCGALTHSVAALDISLKIRLGDEGIG